MDAAANSQQIDNNQGDAIAIVEESKPVHEPKGEVITGEVLQPSDKSILHAERSEFFSGPIPHPD